MAHTMGNQQTKVGLRLDKDSYEAGGVITGRVYLSLSEATKSSRITGLHLRFSGEEYAQVARKLKPHEKTHKHQTHHEPIIEKSTHVLVRQDFPLVNLRDVGAGQYQFPFELPVPGQLPSSMKCQEGSNSSSNKKSFCEIRYKVTAYLVQGGALGSLLPNMYEAPVQIVARAALSVDPPRPLLMEADVYPVNTCFFWKKGHIKLGWQANTSEAAPGQTVQVEAFGENKSQLAVEKIKAIWVETVTWKTASDTSHPHRKVSKRTIAAQSIVASRLPSWVPLEEAQSLVQGDNTHQPLSFSLHLPQDTRDTYNGSAVQVSHMLVVRAVTAGGIATTSPESTCMMKVVRRPNGPLVATATAINTPSSANLHSPFYDTENIVEAEVLPADWSPTLTDVIVIPEAAAVLIDEGAAPMSSSYIASAPREEDLLYPSQSSTTTAPQAPLATFAATAPPESLLNSSTATVDSPSADPQIIEQIRAVITDAPENLPLLLSEPSWTRTVQSVDPREFCSLVKLAPPKAAAGIAQTLARALGSRFQCRYVVALVWALPDSTRMPVVCAVANMPSDLSNNRSIVEQELRDHELVQFRQAMSL